ncbi:sensor histidine kinase [Microtetraspora sp. NBRC 13810]|uniref:sensor histidine kinase n=1 Tax=Microtetraspora sp. NBRC 13810 TaxID=3030990 RepID=UPI0025564565|nr:sensor histidine kinase [Microtetraspora sp. NBRC 13810]
MRLLFTRRLSRGQLVAFDCLAGAGVVIGFAPAAADSAVPGWAKVAVPLGLGLPLAVRRLWPRSVFCVVLGIALVAVVLQMMRAPYLAPAYALYAVAISEHGRRAPLPPLPVAVPLVAVMAALALTSPWWGTAFDDALFGLVVLGVAWTAGLVVGERRAHTAETAERLARESVIEERLRIARELHDVVAHSMGLIAVKAGVANHVMRTRPQEAHDALRVIETASREALVEMRHLLGVLRTDPAELGPAPGVEGLPQLADRATQAGVAVELDVRGATGLPQGVELSVYRIVQEALTNVVKHAAPARCRVEVEADGRQVRIEVTDDGPGRRTSPAQTAGHGLIGMRERVMMYGGAFEAGPAPGTGFRVLARLPYEAAS